jgi:pyruvate dehydrogenase E1 component
VATSDYVRALPEVVAPYLGGRLWALGTDGFGRSDTRKALRRCFAVDAQNGVVAALYSLFREKQLDPGTVKQAAAEFGINPDSPDPWTV